jgi:hypothetical protein
MAKTYLYRYAVTGKPSFPYDMLRYDAAWPASEADSAKLYSPRGGEDGNIVVTLHSHKLPTEGRWRSFGWYVRDDSNTIALMRIALD